MPCEVPFKKKSYVVAPEAENVGDVPAQTELPDDTVAFKVGMSKTVLVNELETAVSPQASIPTEIVPEDNIELVNVEPFSPTISTPLDFH